MSTWYRRMPRGALSQSTSDEFDDCSMSGAGGRRRPEPHDGAFARKPVPRHRRDEWSTGPAAAAMLSSSIATTCSASVMHHGAVARGRAHRVVSSMPAAVGMLPTLAGVARSRSSLQQAAAVLRIISPLCNPARLRCGGTRCVASRLQPETRRSLMPARWLNDGDRSWRSPVACRSCCRCQLGLIVKDQRVVGDCTEFPKDDTEPQMESSTRQAPASHAAVGSCTRGHLLM